jgi:hypothetical protein
MSGRWPCHEPDPGPGAGAEGSRNAELHRPGVLTGAVGQRFGAAHLLLRSLYQLGAYAFDQFWITQGLSP